MFYLYYIVIVATHACDSYYHPTYGITGKCGSVSSCEGPDGGTSGGGGYVTGKCPGNSQQVCCFTGKIILHMIKCPVFLKEQ